MQIITESNCIQGPVIISDFSEESNCVAHAAAAPAHSIAHRLICTQSTPAASNSARLPPILTRTLAEKHISKMSHIIELLAN